LPRAPQQRRTATRRTTPRRSTLLKKRRSDVAITGAIGAGKSEALRAFARHGAATISSDEIVHDLIARDPEVRKAVTEVPLLYETGGEERFDEVVVVTAPKALRDARRTPFPGDRELRLISDREKAKKASFVYENTGSLEELDAFVADVVAKIIGS
jgi:dephospho-CoA kinase